VIRLYAGRTWQQEELGRHWGSAGFANSFTTPVKEPGRRQPHQRPAVYSYGIALQAALKATLAPEDPNKMSGVEVLGLLLAIIPIFQAATDPKAQLAPFEHILTAFSSRRKTQKLDEFLKNLHYEVSMLQITLSRLIDQLDALTDGHRSQLKLGNGWQEYDVVDALQHRLGYGYDSFYIHLTELLEQLESLVEDKTIDLPLGQTEIVRPKHVFDFHGRNCIDN